MPTHHPISFRHALVALQKATSIPVASGNPYREEGSMRFASRDGASAAGAASNDRGYVARHTDPITDQDTRRHVDERAQDAWNRGGADAVLAEIASRTDQDAVTRDTERLIQQAHPAHGKTMADMIARDATLNYDAMESALFSNPERLAKATQIAADYIVEQAKTAIAGRRAVIVIGLPGSGKTSVINAFQEDLHGIEIDADYFKKQLPEFNGGLGAMDVHPESSVAAKHATALALEHGYNVILPKIGGLGNERSIRKQIDALKAHNYTVEVHLVQLDRAESKRRVVQRYLGDKEKPGTQLVPATYLDRLKGNEPIRLMQKFVEDGTLDGTPWSILHNNVERGAPYGIVAHKGSGRLLNTIFRGKNPGQSVRNARRSD